MVGGNVIGMTWMASRGNALGVRAIRASAAGGVSLGLDVVFFVLAAPIIERLFGIERITPELAGRLADHTADVLLHGIGTGARG